MSNRARPASCKDTTHGVKCVAVLTGSIAFLGESLDTTVKRYAGLPMEIEPMQNGYLLRVLQSTLIYKVAQP